MMYNYGYRYGYDEGAGSSPSAIGTIFDIDFTTLANLNDFTEVNPGVSSYVLDGGYLKITGTPSTSFGGNAIMYDEYISGLEGWVLTVDYVIKTHPSSYEGMIVTFKADSSITSNPRKDSFVHLRNNGHASDGQGYRYFNDTTTLTPSVFSGTPLVAGGTVTVDDTYRMTITRSTYGSGALFTIKIENLSNPEENEGTLTYSYTSTGGQLDMNSSKFGVGTTGGTHWITNMKLTSTEQKDVDYIVIHDSIGAGYCSTTLSDRWLDEVEAANTSLTFTRSGGQGDRVDTAINKNDEYQLINPTKAIIHIGTNQVIQSGAASAQTDYDTLISNLIADGVSEFIHISALPRAGSTAINTFNTHLSTTYNSGVHTYVDVNTTMNDANSLDAAYDCGDGVHPNDAGQTVISSAINLVL